jgi:hypothetical protein
MISLRLNGGGSKNSEPTTESAGPDHFGLALTTVVAAMSLRLDTMQPSRFGQYLFAGEIIPVLGRARSGGK